MKADRQDNYKSNNKKTYDKTHYIDGNTVRKVAPVPEYDRERKKQPNQPKRQPAKRTRRKYKQGIDFFTMSFLTVALLLTVYVCIAYLQDQSTIREINKEIIALENELSNTRDANNFTATTLDQAIDFDYIYEVAVGKLGMVFPNENQTIRYKKPDHDYVRQYQEIPEVKLSTLLDKLLP